jgi:hypothetical protein
MGATISQAKWRLVQQYTRDIQPITYNGLLPNGNLNPVSVTLRIPTDRRNSIKNDSGVFVQDKWTINRATINAGLRWDWFISAVDPEALPAGTFNQAVTYEKCPDGKNDLNANCVGRVTNWKDVNPRIGLAYDLFGNGKTAVKASVARYVNGVGLAANSITDNNNPETTVGLLDARPWRDIDNNGSPFDAGGNLQMNELSASTASANFGRNVASTTLTDPAVLDGWFARAYNLEYTVSAQHELAPRVSVSGGWYRRTFGNQTVTVDQRYDKSSYDGPFCLTAPSDPNLPGGGGYQVCGLYDLKPALVGLAPRSLLTFSSNYGGESDVYQGYDVSLTARPRSGAFIQAGISATRHVFDECGLVDAGVKSVTLDGTAAAIGLGTRNASSELTEIYPDGSRACHEVYPYRPDAKILGSYTLPFDIQFSGTYQFTRGVQTGGAGTSVLATWTAPAAAVTQALGRPLSAGRPNGEVISLIQPGTVYGNYNLNQVDLRASKRFRFSQYRFRVDFDAYNIFNSNWPFAVTNTFSTLPTSQYLRPTNVLQSRFFKVGAQFDF